MDLSNCTSFGGRKADPVDKGTDGGEGMVVRPGVCCCGFVASGVSPGGVPSGVDVAPPGVGFGGLPSGGVGFGGLPSGFGTVSGGFGVLCGLRALLCISLANDRPKWNRGRWHMSEPYLSTQGCCGIIFLFTVLPHNFPVLETFAAWRFVVGWLLGSSPLATVALASRNVLRSVV